MGAILPPARTQFLDDLGRPLTNGLVYTFAQGTTTPKATYKDRALSIANTNPINLDAAGSASMWGSGAYTMTVKNVVGSLVYTGDTTANEYDPTAVDINGGTIDGTDIGTTIPGAGRFTSLTITGGIDATPIGGATPAAGAFTTLTASGVFNVGSNNFKVDAAIINMNLPQYTGPQTVASLPVVSIAGYRAFVNDATSQTFRDPVVGGGVYRVPVHTNTTGAWVVG